MMFSHLVMNNLNDEMAPLKIGILSLDISCCTACGICWYIGSVRFRFYGRLCD